MQNMVKQVFHVENYWKVTVFYDLDSDLFDVVEDELGRIGFSDEGIDKVREMMLSGKAKAVTCSDRYMHESVVIFNRHESKADYINSIVHEAEHVKQAMLEEYDVEDEGEEPAYTVGYLVGRMWEVACELICT